MMTEPLDEPVPAELVEQPQPPLSIGHLLLWILGCAVVLASYRWLALPVGEGIRQYFHPLDQLVRSLTMGAGVAVVLVFVRRLVTRDAPLPRQPGHWLLVVQGLYWPVYWLTAWQVYGLRGAEIIPRGDWDSYRRLAVSLALYYLWGTVLYLAVLLLLKEGARWRLFFTVAAVLPLLHALLWCCMLGEPRLSENLFVIVRTAVTLVFIVACVLRDGAMHVRRDWLHRAGVWLYIVGNVWYLTLYLLQWILPPQQ